MVSVSIDELAWTEYRRRVVDERQPVLIPLGALEQHGLHMSMNPDVVIPTAISKAVAQNIKALVAPAFAYGAKSQQKSGGGNHLCGTTSLDGHTLSLALRDVLKEFGRHGARRVAVINGHYENLPFATEGIELAIQELKWSGIEDFRVIIISYWDFVTQDTIKKVFPDEFTGWDVEHGGILETSLMLHLKPELVDMSLAPVQSPAKFPPYTVFPPIPEWTPPSGCLSSPADATEEKGKLLFDVTVEGISTALKQEPLWQPS
ncbi:creatininase [Acidocella aromatica]|uniref:Creatinine amidohydrolase n=1 Tax=Acidocella aromatica TaxID=1303579 RepID=A0A840VHX7_9PROT|nr:creatininase [Acidocella aromatica]MBB5374517.1 creatinine amidohydrolase [Acidocella aromatica]